LSYTGDPLRKPPARSEVRTGPLLINAASEAKQDFATYRLPFFASRALHNAADSNELERDKGKIPIPGSMPRVRSLNGVNFT
jgi:hypothetical protein